MNRLPWRALVVEDDPSWGEILAELLSDEGLATDVASGYAEAVALVKEKRHRLAVVDLSLGGYMNRDGLRVLEAIRSHDPGCAAILLSGYITVELAVSAIKDFGAYTSLRKETFSRRGFRKLVRRALAEVSPPEPSPTESAKGRQEQPPASIGRALVVEDDAGWRGVLSELLAGAGLEAQECRSFGEALGYLRRERYLLAVVDLSLASSTSPEGNADGYRVLEEARLAGVPTVVVSGTAAPEEIVRAYEERGIFAYLEKQSFERRAFLQVVEDVLKPHRESGGVPGSLTPREREVLALLAQGKTNKEIAEELVISPNTVKRHLQAIFEKLGVPNRAAAAAKAVEFMPHREDL